MLASDIVAAIGSTNGEGGLEDGGREAEVKNSSSESAAGTKKGLLSEGFCGSVVERLNAELGVVIRLLERPPSPHVSCRRRGFEEDPGTREELAVVVGGLSTTNECQSATMTRGPMLCTHFLVLWQESQPQFTAVANDLTFFFFAVGKNGSEIVAPRLRRQRGAFRSFFW
jgi:hypothetical protein